MKYSVGRTYRARLGHEGSKPFTDRTITRIDPHEDPNKNVVTYECRRTLIGDKPRIGVTGISAFRKWTGSDVTDEVESQ